MAAFYLSDVGVVLDFTLLNETGGPLDLTGATVDLVIPNKWTKAVTVTSATKGTAEYRVESGDFTAAGTYKGQARVTIGADSIHSEAVEITVKAMGT